MLYYPNILLAISVHFCPQIKDKGGGDDVLLTYLNLANVAVVAEQKSQRCGTQHI